MFPIRTWGRLTGLLIMTCLVHTPIFSAEAPPADASWITKGVVITAPGREHPTPLSELTDWFTIDLQQQSIMVHADAPAGDYRVRWPAAVPDEAEAMRLTAELFKANQHQVNAMEATLGDSTFPLGANTADHQWQRITGQAWPLPSTSGRSLELHWHFHKPHAGEIWRTGLRNMRIETGDPNEARQAWRQPLAAGLPPLADPAQREPWDHALTLRDGMMFKDQQPFFPIGYVFGTDERALAQSRAMGGNAIHFEVGWSVSEGPGPIPARQFHTTLETVRRARAWGLASFVLLTGHYIPAWFAEAHPQQQAMPLGSDGKMTGSWFRYSLHYPPFREHITDFWTAAAPLLEQEPGVMGINFWNEPSYGGTWNRGDQFGDYAPWSIDNYRQHLQQTYGSIEALRNAHHLPYESFDAIQPPRHPEEQTRQAWLDWMTFGQQSFADFFQWQRSVIRNVAPTVPLANKKQTNPWDSSTASSGTNWHLIGDSEDVYGINTYGGSAFGNRNKLDAARSYAQDKPVMIFEVNAMPPNAEARTAERVRAQLWSLVVGGARGIFIFAMIDTPDHGLLSDEAVKPEVRPEYVRFTQTISNYQRELASPHVPARAAVLYSTTAALQYTGDRVPKHVFGAYNLLRNSHYQADILPEERCTPEGLAEYELIVLPSYAILHPDAIAALNEWVAAGGKVLAFAGALATNAYLVPIDPPRSLGIETRSAAVGDRTNQTISAPDVDIERYINGEVAITGVERVSALDPEQSLIPGAAIQTEQRGKVLAYNSDSYPAVVADPSGQVVYCAFASVYSEPMRGMIEGVLREQFGLHQAVRLLHDDHTEAGIMTSLRQDYQDHDRRYLLALSTLSGERTIDIETLEEGWQIKREHFHDLNLEQTEQGTRVRLPAREVFLFELIRRTEP
ncbi:MAG: alpha-amylase family protein [Phycisphaeraceae bacterium]